MAERDRTHLVETIRRQAGACGRLGSALYADVLRQVAADVAEGGVCADVLAGQEQAPESDAVALRLAGSVHRLVLAGQAPELAMFYPSVGGEWHPRAGWRAWTNLLAQRGDDIQALLGQPPQTNEVGRSTALMGGLLHVNARLGLPVRLFEIGASAGLNLRADHYFHVSESGTAYGREDSPVQLSGAWRGRKPPTPVSLRVVERLGGDVAPIDPLAEDGRLRLMAYVWPDQLDRIERLANAIEVAKEVSAPVERCSSAAEMVSRIELRRVSVTVLWHSVMWQYLATEEQASVAERIEQLGSQATSSAPFAHLRMEPMRRVPTAEPEFLITLRLWPGGQQRVLGSAHPHGIPTTWE